MAAVFIVWYMAWYLAWYSIVWYMTCMGVYIYIYVYMFATRYIWLSIRSCIWLLYGHHLPFLYVAVYVYIPKRAGRCGRYVFGKSLLEKLAFRLGDTRTLLQIVRFAQAKRMFFQITIPIII